ncbi:anti-sigma factor [Dinghuibacter silviterrae]|uniref:Anti-sigma-K factor rskA n=1 Tax=Dinghuibacter silviterrae TaxID=1539049 RepID=A0A4R8DV10_9BACT|nr:anti-sigma factor [Dinghuibacter silviterrae]TDX01816.1 anti-sigma-K factor rskA [Dinghuibacter silviterrae]
MTLEELISSGKLELYVAGVLSDREMSDIGILAVENPAVASEIEKIEKVMIEWLSPQEFQMPDTEKEKQIDEILGRIRKEPKIPLNGIPPVSGNGHHTAPAPVRPLHPKRQPQWAMAALVAGLVLTTGLTVWMAVRYARLAPEATALRTQYQDLANAQNQYQDQMTRMQTQVNLMRNILTRRIELSTVAGNKITSADNYMLVYWNPETKKLLLVDAHLPELSSQQQYQLWALYDGKPIDAGVFDPKDLQASSSFQKDIPNAQAFAVTVEPKGGSKTPTLSNLCMMGKL